MQGLRSRRLIGAGKCKDGLYQMGMLGNKRKAMAVTGDMWHKRLGHAGDKKLSRINFLSNFSFKNNGDICDSCSKSKLTRKPFPTSTTKTSACFDLLHCDIWGKYRTPSFSKTNYFLTIVDDYSRGVWVFLLMHKFEASECLIGFHKMIKTQFEKNVKRIRCDNGGEFTSNRMLSFYADQGIILETTCPHTPQQNGVVERKHRHLLETARALKNEANLPTRFWGECILAATVLGCMAYYRNIETKGDKFEIRGRPGVFMGYPSGTKGYKIYDPNHNKIIISRDVIFAEKFFPFTTKIEENKHEDDIFNYPLDEKSEPTVPIEANEELGPDSQATHIANNEHAEVEDSGPSSPVNHHTDPESPHTSEIVTGQKKLTSKMRLLGRLEENETEPGLHTSKTMMSNFPHP
ncbi:hypothetical protein L1987_44825 [Smallanthus sonchifolius]|uniref:Uncharacterized protein n=1 Tax=Smallanthus sonchifolius TaxID=185202 RepID=A0ACB9GRK8_9ASTR|nr:hypothetical protein L1987_44825 [Smallanthus sonchifolius]